MIPWPVLAGLGVAALVLVGFALFRRARGATAWALAAAVLWAALADPTLTVEQRDLQPDALLVVADQSPSQDIGDRQRQRDDALRHVRDSVAGLTDIDLHVVHTKPNLAGVSATDVGTRLFEAMRSGLAEIPKARAAAVVLITDGQIHDMPPDDAWDRIPGPVHVLLTGVRGESDRQIIVEQAPSYGLIDRKLALRVRIDDLNGADAGMVRLDVSQDGEPGGSFVVPVGQSVDVDFTLERAGPSVIEVEVEPGPAELTLANNRAGIVVNGVRDRLRVLLVSGEPHAGERAWRNLLKADPAVDLVHFTILRPPEKQDGTPVRELSLISFPVRELFEIKLEEFDLVIFDRYRRRGVMPQRYVDNIVEYVRNGGALLAAVGPTFAGPLSLGNTPLGDILPALASGSVRTDPYRPAITETGRRHPVTAGLVPAEQDPWGHWYRYVDADQIGGSTLMTGPDDKPLLILDRVEEGRLALLLSDHIWLWARGYDGGGPQAELVRRLAHWLMGEPELEENRLTATLRGGTLEIARLRLVPTDRPVTVTLPNGDTEIVDLAETPDGGLQLGTLEVDQAGIYRLSDGELTAIAAAGDIEMTEHKDVRASDEILRPLAEQSGGGVLWLAESGLPELRQVRGGQDYVGQAAITGRSWIGLRRNGDFIVTGLTLTSLLPGILVLILAIGGLMLAWRREGA
ncbi:MAG: hypothetical protein GY791_21205 [Alphaproteobacteria bacterium]|nr:hypothetical protein [Alphaproteobacteria bacterium]